PASTVITRPQTRFLESPGLHLELHSFPTRRSSDLIEMLEETGFCSGIENYSAPMAGRKKGETPTTLMDFFPKDYLLVVDESHVTDRKSTRLNSSHVSISYAVFCSKKENDRSRGRDK